MSISQRVTRLIEQMTPEEKVAQLCGAWLTPHRELRTSARSLMEGRALSVGKCRRNLPQGVGYISDVASTDDLTPSELAAVIRDLQRYLREETRLGILVLISDDAISGFEARGATSFAQQIGMSCTWNPQGVEAQARCSGTLMRAVGVHVALEGVEVAQWYVTPPGGGRRLLGFARVAFGAGEACRVTIKAPIELLGWHDEELWLVVGAGEYAMAVGASAVDDRFVSRFSVRGPTRVFTRRRVFGSRTVVEKSE